MSVAPNRSACARISPMRSGPRMPSRAPGQFSTSVVSISCPPASIPSMTSGCRLARAVYRAAVNPAGPEPIMVTLRIEEWGSLEVFVDYFPDFVLRHQAHDLVDHLAALEQEQRRDPADVELDRR